MRSIFSIILLGMALAGWTQRVEVNPNIKWSFVQYQEMELQSGRTYNFEFPGEKGYDYVATITHDRSDLVVNIGIYDIQYDSVRQRTDSTGNPSVDLNFTLQDDGTYLVVFGLNASDLNMMLPAKVAIVRRPVVPK